jgi:hypothetical protein
MIKLLLLIIIVNMHTVRNVDPTPTGEVRAGKTILRVIG